jgi:HK97 family phage portal protein
MHSLLKRGNGYLGIVSRDGLGFPDEVVMIHPDQVEVRMEGRRKRIYVDGSPMTEFTPFDTEGDVLHILGLSDDGVRGLAPIEDGAQAIGAGLALEEHASRFFSNGATTTGTIELPAGSVPTQDQLESLKKQFNRKHAGLKNAHKPIVLANGATFKPISLPNDQAQFIESRKFSVSEIARLFGVPPHMIGDVEKSTSWGSGIEQQGIGFVTYTLMPWLVQLQDAFSLFLPRGQFVRFNTNGLLRGDAAARASYYQALGSLKAIEINEIRALEDMPPLDDGDQPPPAPNESIQP